MKPKLKLLLVTDVLKHLETLVEQGCGNLPVVGTDIRAYYPIEIFEVLNESGYPRALQVRVRPDARFDTDHLPGKAVQTSTIEYWNAEADRITDSCGPFA